MFVNPRPLHFSACLLTLLCAALLTVPAAAQDVLTIVDDKVGINNESPADTLDVHGEGVTVNVFDTNTTEAARILLRLTNEGRVNFNMHNTASGENWQFSNSAIGFQINETVSSNVEMRVTTGGDLHLEGQVYASSSRDVKDSFEPVDGGELLARLAEVPIRRWTYRQNDVPHIGPMAEDFHAAFAVGDDATMLSPSDTAGVALAAIQELKRQVDEREAEIARLEARLDEEGGRRAALEQRLRRLEERLAER